VRVKNVSSAPILGAILEHDVIVVGAGPAGLIAAADIARKGHDVIVLEEHGTIGVPDHCAGLLSISGLKTLGLHPPSDVIQNVISGARIHAPSGLSIEINRSKKEALVIDRRKFDEWLGLRAEEHGAKIVTRSRAVNIRIDRSRGCTVTIQGAEHRRLTSKSVINAEGFRGVISKTLGLPAVPKSAKYPAYQYEMSNVHFSQDQVHMFYGRKFAPGFFAWMIPLGDGRARVGLASMNRSKMRLDAARHHHPVIHDWVRDAKIERGFGGVVLVGMPVKRFSVDRALGVGDSIGMVKPTTGGGVILGGQTARIAAQVLSGQLEREDLSVRGLGHFDKGCRVIVKREIRPMHIAQRALTLLTDKGLDSVIRDARDLNLLDIVKREGDMDYQGRVISRLLQNPRMVLVGLRAIRHINPFMNGWKGGVH